MSNMVPPAEALAVASPPPHRKITVRLYDQPLALLLVVGSFLAVSVVFAKAAPGAGWHPLALLQWAILGGAGLLFVFTRAAAARARGTASKSRSARPDWRSLSAYLLVSGLLFVAPNMIGVVAAPKVGAGFVALTYAFPLVLTYALAVLIRLERFNWLRGLGVLAGLIGGVLLAGGGADVSADAAFWAVVTLAIPVFLAAGNIYRTLKWPEGAKPVDLALGMMAVAFAALGVFNIVMGIQVTPAAWTTTSALLVGGLIAVFAVQYGLYFRLQQVAGPVYLSQIGSVAAIAGLGLGYLVFSEVPNLAKLGAIAAVALGIVFVTLGKGRR